MSTRKAPLPEGVRERFRREVNDKLSVVSHRGARGKAGEAIVRQQCEDFLVEEFEECVHQAVAAAQQERARADEAVEVCDRLRREVIGMLGYARAGIANAIGETNVRVLELRVKEAYLVASHPPPTPEDR